MRFVSARASDMNRSTLRIMTNATVSDLEVSFCSRILWYGRAPWGIGLGICEVMSEGRRPHPYHRRRSRDARTDADFLATSGYHVDLAVDGDDGLSRAAPRTTPWRRSTACCPASKAGRLGASRLVRGQSGRRRRGQYRRSDPPSHAEQRGSSVALSRYRRRNAGAAGRAGACKRREDPLRRIVFQCMVAFPIGRVAHDTSYFEHADFDLLPPRRCLSGSTQQRVERHNSWRRAGPKCLSG